MKTNKIILISLLYVFLTVLFLLLFLEQSPFQKNKNIKGLKDVFSIGWNFFTGDPRANINVMYYYKNNKWVLIDEGHGFHYNLERTTDAVMIEISSAVFTVPESKWKEYPSVHKCFKDSMLLTPKYNYADLTDFKFLYIQKDFIHKKYGDYFLIVLEKKMPWSWIKNYDQKEMACRSLVIRL